MTLKENFEAQPWADLLAHRKATTLLMLEHFKAVATLGLNQIIETGTARMRDNWQGDGQSTLVWDWAAGEIKGSKVLSIDLDPKAVEVAREQTKHVRYVVGDSIQVLSELGSDVLSKVGLLYLDSLDFDWSSGDASARHHLAELATVWERLPSGCMIIVDDRHSPSQGKHTAIATFMSEKKIEALFVEYQVGWIKP